MANITGTKREDLPCRYKIEIIEHRFMDFCEEIGFVVDDINSEEYARDIGLLRLVLSGTYYWAFKINVNILKKCCTSFAQKRLTKTRLYEFLEVINGKSFLRDVLEGKYKEPKRKLKPIIR